MDISNLKDGDRITLADLRKLGGLQAVQGGRSARKTDYCNDGEPSESLEQQTVAYFLDQLGLRWCHVPNGGARYRGAAGLLKAEGVKSGVSDILIFTPPPNSPEHVGVAIELKRAKGGKVSDEQQDWLDGLADCRWLTRVCYGSEEAISFITSLGYQKINA